METKLILDCTKPAAPEKFPDVCRVPPEKVAETNVADWILEKTPDFAELWKNTQG
jgi:hypothetical protein